MFPELSEVVVSGSTFTYSNQHTSPTNNGYEGDSSQDVMDGDVVHTALGGVVDDAINAYN